MKPGSFARLTKLAAIPVAVFAALSIVRFCQPKIKSYADAFDFAVFLFEDRTTYAAGYSEKGFAAVRLEMTEDQVTALLGQPLAKQTSSDLTRTFWRYTEGPNDSSYFFRVIVFDQKKLVSEKDAHYFAD